MHSLAHLSVAMNVGRMEKREAFGVQAQRKPESREGVINASKWIASQIEG